MPELADIDWVQMADRIKILPIVALGAFALVGLVVYLVSRKSRDPEARPSEGPAATVSPPAPSAPAPAAPRKAADPPPASKNPGEKILEGADGAYQKGMFPTALKFYKDFELRYAGTEVYDQNILKVWERIHTCGAKLDPKDDTLPAYLEERRKLADRWKAIKPLLAGESTSETRDQVRRFEEALPPTDGRRKLIEAWLTPGKDEK
jgi:hypothetical protein